MLADRLHDLSRAIRLIVEMRGALTKRQSLALAADLRAEAEALDRDAMRQAEAAYRARKAA